MKIRTQIFIAVVFLAGLLYLHIRGVDSWLLQEIQLYKERLLLFVRDQYILAVVSFIMVYSVAMSLLVPIGAILTLTGGFLFGALWGSLYALVGATLGASCAFLLVRNVWGVHLQKRYAQHLHNFNKAVARNGRRYLFAVRLIIIVPYALVNLLAGLTCISFKTFFWTTVCGILPGTIVYAFAGQQLATIDSIKNIFSWPVITAFILLGVLAFVPMLLQLIWPRMAQDVSKLEEERF